MKWLNRLVALTKTGNAINFPPEWKFVIISCILFESLCFCTCAVPSHHHKERSVHSCLCQRRGLLRCMFSLMVCSDGGLKPQLMCNHILPCSSAKNEYSVIVYSPFVFPNPYAVVQIDVWYFFGAYCCGHSELVSFREELQINSLKYFFWWHQKKRSI